MWQYEKSPLFFFLIKLFRGAKFDGFDMAFQILTSCHDVQETLENEAGTNKEPVHRRGKDAGREKMRVCFY